MPIIKSTLTAILLLLMSIRLVAGSPVLEREFGRFSSDPALKHASWSFLVTDLETGIPLISHDHQRALCPASVQKLITTASALITFGAQHTLPTELQYDGFIDENGTLQGNLYIFGGGDPSLGSSFWDKSPSFEDLVANWLELLRSAGIARVLGDIIADDSAFDRDMIPRKYLWEDIGNYYGAGSSALTFNENTYTVFFDAGQSMGAPARVKSVLPEIPSMKLLNEVTTGQRGSGDQVYIFGAPYVSDRLLTGTVPLGATSFPVRGSMPDPALFLVQYFTDYLKNNGIAVEGQATSVHALLTRNTISGSPANINMQTVTPYSPITPVQLRAQAGVWMSPPLTDIINRANTGSVNVYTENLLKLLGRELFGQGSFKAGVDAMVKIWSDRGMDVSGMKLHDGSGLAPSNRVTAGQIGFILSYMWRHESFRHFHESLPLAGHSGSLSGFFRNTASEGVLRAKSGYLGNVRSYAGYTTMKNGRQVAFVLIVNDYDGSPAAMRNKMFQLMDAIAK